MEQSLINLNKETKVKGVKKFLVFNKVEIKKINFIMKFKFR